MSSPAPASSAGISQGGSMPLGPRISRMSSSGAAAVPDPDSDPGAGADPDAGADPELEFDEGAEGDGRAGVSAGAYVGPGARAGGGGKKSSGVEGARVTGAE